MKDRYCILERIGKGGTGQVYLARDMELGLDRAVKELPVSRKGEAEILRRLAHPSIPGMIDFIEKEDVCYLVMEYIRGKSLGDWQRAGRIFSGREVLDYGIAAAGVLGYLHGQKPPVCYGDLKPDNLMLAESGKIYLVDFGSVVSDYGGNRRICEGTRGYAAPEQYAGRVEKRSDVYALGRTLQALLGKRRRFLFFRNMELYFVLAKCCRKKAAGRYPDMKTLEQRLTGIREKQKIFRRKLCQLFAMAGILTAAVCVGKWKEPRDFFQALTEVTALYSQENLSGKNRDEILEEGSQKLREMLRIYPETEEQCRLLLLLALNEELRGEMERAALYYEQLMLYEESFGEAYGAYGMFLWRLGQTEASRKLWEDYRERLDKGEITEEDSRNLRIWEERIHEQERTMGGSGGGVSADSDAGDSSGDGRI